MRKYTLTYEATATDEASAIAMIQAGTATLRDTKSGLVPEPKTTPAAAPQNMHTVITPK